MTSLKKTKKKTWKKTKKKTIKGKSIKKRPNIKNAY